MKNIIAINNINAVNNKDNVHLIIDGNRMFTVDEVKSLLGTSVDITVADTTDPFALGIETGKLLAKYPDAEVVREEEKKAVKRPKKATTAKKDVPAENTRDASTEKPDASAEKPKTAEEKPADKTEEKKASKKDEKPVVISNQPDAPQKKYDTGEIVNKAGVDKGRTELVQKVVDKVNAGTVAVNPTNLAFQVRLEMGSFGVTQEEQDAIVKAFLS